MTLEYIREYRTYFHIATNYGVSESVAYKIISWVEDTLIKHPTFALLGRKVILKSDIEYEVVLIDAFESPIERPKKRVRNKKRIKNRNNKQKHFYSGKKKRYTLKSQVVVDKKSKKVMENATQRHKGTKTQSEDDISHQIISAAIEVHRTLGGPGLLESIYESALCH